MTTALSIYIRRKNKVLLEGGTNKLPNEFILNFLANIERLGYTMSVALADVVRSLSREDANLFYHEIVEALKENVGAHVQYQPMYPNFPEQVKEASETELYSNAFIHYLGDWIGMRILPGYKKKDRPALKDQVRLKAIDVGTRDDFEAIFRRLLGAKTSISETDKKDIAWFVSTYQAAIYPLAPQEIPVKENVAFYIGCLLKENVDGGEDQLKKHAKTATDILRIATSVSDGDVSLAENTKFKTISRRNRKLLLTCLESIGSVTEDMLRYKNRWKRLGEKLHPFEYKHRFPKCFEAFDIIRNDKPFNTFNSKVEAALIHKDITNLTTLLKPRPGELARRLDKLVRLTENQAHVIEAFRQVAEKVSTPVILQVLTHFRHRNLPKDMRVFFPKGDVGKVAAVVNKLENINQNTCDEIVRICEDVLVRKFSKYKPLGKVFIDENLEDYTVPFAQRSASKALKTISRGSKLDLPPGNTLRFFIYWKQGENRADLDLSALALNGDSGYKMQITYYNLKDLGGYHSGDITSAPDGASEFIDIEIDTCLSYGVRYVVMSVNSFTQQPYKDLPVCFAGFMIRQHANSGEIYDPLTVENKFDLTGNTKISIPLIIDLQERKVIWTDISLSHRPSTANNVLNNMSSITIINKAMTTLIKPSLYDLLNLHAKARGERVMDITKADIIFGVDKGIKPTDIDVLVSEYL